MSEGVFEVAAASSPCIEASIPISKSSFRDMSWIMFTRVLFVSISCSHESAQVSTILSICAIAKLKNLRIHSFVLHIAGLYCKRALGRCCAHNGIGHVLAGDFGTVA